MRRVRQVTLATELEEREPRESPEPPEAPEGVAALRPQIDRGAPQIRVGRRRRVYRCQLWLAVPAGWRIGQTRTVEGVDWVIEGIGSVGPAAVTAAWLADGVRRKAAARATQRGGVTFVSPGELPLPIAPPHAPGRRSRLTPFLVEAWRDRYARGGVSQAGLARRVGVPVSVMHALLTGQTWRQAGGPLVTPDGLPKRPAIQVDQVEVVRAPLTA